jgi:hypothetical protein
MCLSRFFVFSFYEYFACKMDHEYQERQKARRTNLMQLITTMTIKSRDPTISEKTRAKLNRSCEYAKVTIKLIEKEIGLHEKQE